MPRMLGLLPADPVHPELLGMVHDALALLPPAVDTHWTRPGDVWPDFGNLRYANCTSAAMALATLHMSRVAQSPITWPINSVLALFRATSDWSGDLNDPGHGAKIDDVLAYMQRTGQDIGLQAPEVLTAALPMDPRNIDHLARAVGIFGWVCAGGLVTETMANSINARWDYVSGSPIMGRHCYVMVDVRTVDTRREFLVPTWGETFWISEECILHTTDQARVCPSREHWTHIDGSTPPGPLFDAAIGFAARLTG